MNQYLPHGPAMRLIDSVIEMDAQSICCTVTSHRDAQHPMRLDGRLGSACGVEMAAQAIALHCVGQQQTQAAAAPARAGMLTSIRDLQIRVARLDDIAEDLQVRAHLLSGDEVGALYSFSVERLPLTLLAPGQELEPDSLILLSGRVSVVNFVR